MRKSALSPFRRPLCLASSAPGHWRRRVTTRVSIPAAPWSPAIPRSTPPITRSGSATPVRVATPYGNLAPRTQVVRPAASAKEDNYGSEGGQGVSGHQPKCAVNRGEFE